MINKSPVSFSWVTIVLLVLFWAACASFYPVLPDQVATHWNIKGEADDYSHKSVVAFIMPLLPLLIYVFMTVLPKFDPKKDNYLKFSGSYEKIRMAIVSLMVVVTLLPLLSALGYNVNISLIMRIGLPVLMIIIGNYMGKVRFNYFMGFRLPWTLANEDVWNKTHRLGGKLMVSGGVIALLGIFTSPEVGFVLVMAGIFIPIVIATVYSYFTYKKLTQG